MTGATSGEHAPIIRVQGMGKRFGDRTILEDVSVDFARGQVVALIGPSGGGKTTLLRCLNGLEGFDAGTIRLGPDVLEAGGERANRRALASIRGRVGFVFQQWHLFAHRTALGNVIEAPVHVRKIEVGRATEQGRALLEKVGLAHRQGAYPHEMSGGEQQRVAIARALAMEPEVLLLDEPTSALDPERVRELQRILERLAGEGLTMLVVTHEMRFARAIAGRVLVLDGGRIIEDGAPAQVLDAPRQARTRAILGALPDV